MKILLTGASGFIGSHLQRSLGQGGHELVCVSRRNGFDFTRMLRPEDWAPLVDGVDAVINAAGIIAESRRQSFAAVHGYAPVALFKACAHNQVKRVIQISALGVGGRLSTDFLLSKQVADDFLQWLELDWFILRPSLVYGDGGRSSGLFRRLAQWPCLSLPDRGQQWVQPVHIDDLVSTVECCLGAETAQRIIDVAGATPLQFADWLRMMHRNPLALPLKVVNVPPSLALWSTRLAQHIFPLASSDNLRMLMQGSTANVMPLAEFIGRMPRGVEEF